MTLAEMKAETLRRLNESTAAPVFFTDEEIETAVLDGYMELSDATEWYEQYLTIDLLDTRPYYDLRTVVGPEFLAIKPAFHVDTNRWLTPTAVRQLDGHDRRWETVVSVPHRLIMRGLWWLGYWPRVTGDTGTVKQYYTALPPVLTDDDEPGFPVAFHTGCVEFAVADLAAQDAETNRALAAWTQYLATEAGLQAWVDGRAGGPMEHGMGGVMLGRVGQ